MKQYKKNLLDRNENYFYTKTRWLCLEDEDTLFKYSIITNTHHPFLIEDFTFMISSWNLTVHVSLDTQSCNNLIKALKNIIIMTLYMFIHWTQSCNNLIKALKNIIIMTYMFIHVKFLFQLNQAHNNQHNMFFLYEFLLVFLNLFISIPIQNIN